MGMDWIKVEKTTPDKPEIRRMASILGISRFEVFGRCFAVWSYFDDNATDGRVTSVDRSVIDDLAGVVGFALAMIQVGWLQERNNALLLPNFDRHNGKSAKQRALNTRRQSKLRSRKQFDPLSQTDFTPSATNVAQKARHERDKSATREEKRREDPPKPPRGGGRGRRRNCLSEDEMTEMNRARLKAKGILDDKPGIPDIPDGIPEGERTSSV